MVCETSAWGRAVVAVTGAGTKRIASKQEVQNRQTVKRDFIAEATKVKAIDQLRELWAEARASGADEKTLETIIGMSNGLQD
jgi:uncharacterized protein (UPF0335 family)